MCGISGFFQPNEPSSEPELLRELAEMTGSIAHRGPDGDGSWVDPQAGVALGHRRLAVVDLTESGRQPMISSCGRFVVTFNGEIYNYRDLRVDLESRGLRLRSTSDTEVLLETCALLGIEEAVKRLVGMFAFAIYDKQARRLSLVRDQLGIKPLYWTVQKGALAFASELKALRANPGWSPRLDKGAVAAFLRHSYIPAPRTIYEGVYKLEPGTWLEFDGKVTTRRYFDLRAYASKASREPLDFSDEEAVEQLEALLTDAVGRQMISDVPLGAFLSGGIDSSAVVALMQAQSRRPIDTFTIGFEEASFNEASYAKQIATHLGTRHHEYTVTSRDALDLVPQLPHWYDEPFADSSQIPTLLLSAVTRRSVTVALSGDGGDELFAGYSRYDHVLKRISEQANPIGKSLHGLRRILQRLARTHDHELGACDLMSHFMGTLSHWQRPSEVLPGVAEAKGLLWDTGFRHEFPDPLDRMQILDTLTYLPDDILTKVDRASMAVSLEARVPLLDHRVVEFAWSLPRGMKRRDGQGKWILKEVLARHVPRHMFERPKMGFGVPLGDWLQGPLRDWAENLLDPHRLADQGLFDAQTVRSRWSNHLSGKANHQYELWDVLMFQAWADAHPGVC